jgi:CRISPR/Cas system-associated exonuclease Cas4 (RecB family)
MEVSLYDYDLMINGRMDAVYQVPYQKLYYPVDYKTSTRAQNYMDESEELQLYIYAILLRNSEGKICNEGHIYLARTAAELIIKLDDKKMKKVEELCKEASGKYLDGNKDLFKRKKNVFCRWCPYSQIECRDIVKKPAIHLLDYSNRL